MDAFIDTVIEGGELRATWEFWDETPIMIDGEVIDTAKIKREAEKVERTEPKADPGEQVRQGSSGSCRSRGPGSHFSWSDLTGFF